MKHNKKKFIKFTLWLVVFMVTGFGVYNARVQQLEYLSNPHAEAKEIVIDNLGKKIEQLKDEALDSLKQCESAGYEDKDGIIIFDSNNKASIGMFQWQKASVIHYYKTLYNQDITPKDAVIIALDTEKAKKLAHDVIFGTDKGWTNWTNCAKKTGLITTLQIINKLEE